MVTATPQAAWSDTELTAAVRGPQAEAAMEELFRRHRPAVIAYALACSRDPHKAEDLASEAFACTLHAVRTGAGPAASWRPYLFSVVRHTAGRWAATARRTELYDDLERQVAQAPNGAAPETGEERVLQLESEHLVRIAFRSLPRRWQAVLWYTAVEGRSTAAVGKLLGISPSGVASLASRARAGLRRAYGAAHSGPDNDDGARGRVPSLLGAAVRLSGLDVGRHRERQRSAYVLTLCPAGHHR
ncbi:sigma-70 family RNA polymerase sigma factor [Streptomyces sp. L2]|uniref:RNA polymerase sigma factor n=1 Tax=Streptomyces sp. L2 TaxID=2162665 RepID=UPI0013E9295A|nr:sigma-70 family RNA polymerase sigma factor [Streptomyces sp. L2]